MPHIIHIVDISFHIVEYQPISDMLDTLGYTRMHAGAVVLARSTPGLPCAHTHAVVLVRHTTTSWGKPDSLILGRIRTLYPGLLTGRRGGGSETPQKYAIKLDHGHDQPGHSVYTKTLVYCHPTYNIGKGLVTSPFWLHLR